MVRDKGHSTERRQNAGIRQGCPLSPYLFIMVMTVMFHDIHKDIERAVTGNEFADITTTELLYADDTFLIGKNARTINILLHSM